MCNCHSNIFVRLHRRIQEQSCHHCLVLLSTLLVVHSGHCWCGYNKLFYSCPWNKELGSNILSIICPFRKIVICQPHLRCSYLINQLILYSVQSFTNWTWPIWTMLLPLINFYLFVSHELRITGHSVTVCTVLHSVHSRARFWFFMISYWVWTVQQKPKIYTLIKPLKKVKEGFEKFLLETFFLDDFSEFKWAIKFKEQSM